MIDAVFISDLHLQPDNSVLSERFNRFIEWAQEHQCQNIYILGDFFHAWAGDDSLDDWSLSIAHSLKALTEQGINIYLMAGNRDFLLGKRFGKCAGAKLLPEPTVITLGGRPILLVHGDRYCTLDRSHQRFRALTRNRLFKRLFLLLPLSWRSRIVGQVRKKSQNNRSKPAAIMDVVAADCIEHMRTEKATRLIHGHTHKPGHVVYQTTPQPLERYILSDWDDIPLLLCYHKSKGFNFTHLQ